MAGARFDLFEAGRLESREGSLAKGAVTYNGFMEVDAEKERWSWQRPALKSGMAAPFSGQALMLLALGGTETGTGTGTDGEAFLRGVFGISFGTGTGTNTGATTWTVKPPPPGIAFVLVAGNLGGLARGYSTSVGALTPSSVNGVAVATFGVLNPINPTGVSRMVLQGTQGQSFFTWIRVGTNTLFTSTASFTPAGTSSGANTTWQWPPRLYSGTAIPSTYTGAYI